MASIPFLRSTSLTSTRSRITRRLLFLALLLFILLLLYYLFLSSDDRQIEEVECYEFFHPHVFKVVRNSIGNVATTVVTTTDISAADVTLISQFTPERITTAARVLAAWPGPVSFAVYANEADSDNTVKMMRGLLGNRSNVQLHIVRKEHDRYYPINQLRNVALDAVHTSHVFTMDIDFVMPNNMYQQLLDTASQLRERTAYVVPAFQSYMSDWVFPQNKPALIKEIQSKTVKTFKAGEWEPGHSPTDYDTWYNTSQPFEIEWRLYYEPYIMASRIGLPRYDERFMGFGLNKVQHIQHLAALGYKFVVMLRFCAALMNQHPDFYYKLKPFHYGLYLCNAACLPSW